MVRFNRPPRTLTRHHLLNFLHILSGRLRIWCVVVLIVAFLFLVACKDDGEPEIEVRDDGNTVMTPATVFDFGNTSSTSPRTFSIHNLGDGDLVLTGSPDPVAISGADPGDYNISTQPSVTVTPGTSTTFDVDFIHACCDGGTYTATLTIENNDADEGSFSFGVTGLGSS